MFNNISLKIISIMTYVERTYYRPTDSNMAHALCMLDN